MPIARGRMRVVVVLYHPDDRREGIPAHIADGRSQGLIEVDTLVCAVGADRKMTANPFARRVREGRHQILTALVPLGRLDHRKLICGERLAGGIPDAREVGVFVFEVRILAVFEGGIERPLSFCPFTPRSVPCGLDLAKKVVRTITTAPMELHYHCSSEMMESEGNHGVKYGSFVADCHK